DIRPQVLYVSPAAVFHFLCTVKIPASESSGPLAGKIKLLLIAGDGHASFPVFGIYTLIQRQRFRPYLSIQLTYVNVSTVRFFVLIQKKGLSIDRDGDTGIVIFRIDRLYPFRLQPD